MKAYINNQGIRFVGVMGFQTTQPKGTLDKILDALKATKLKNGKRVIIESADQCVTYHNIPDADAVKVLTDHGIAVNLAENDSFPASEASPQMTNELHEHLERCEKAVQSVKPILAKHGFPDDYRTVTVIGFISTIIEHQESVLLLAMHDKAGSASARVRPIVEGAFRGLWINLPATDAELKKFNEKDEIDLGFGAIAKALDNAYGMGDFFQDFKTRAWNALNSFTHGGMQQIGRRFVKHEVENNYSEEEIYEMTTIVTTMVVILTSFFLKKQGHAAEGDEIQALLETYGPVAEGKKP